MDTRAFLRPIGTALAILAALGVSVYGFYALVAQPEIKITTSQPATLTLLAPDGKEVAKRIDATEATFRVGPGDYMARAQGSEAQTTTQLSARLFSSQTSALELKAPLAAEPVAAAPAAQPVMQGGQLLYFNAATKHLERLDAEGLVSTVDDELEHQDDDGADIERGGVYKTLAVAGGKLVVQIYDRLSVVENGRLQPLNVDGIIEPISGLSVVFGGNSLQESFVVAVDASLYLYQNTAAKPQKLLDLPKKANRLAFGGTRVVAFSDELAYSRESVASAYGDYALEPLMIDVASKETRNFSSGPLTEVTVSLDGSRATLQKRDSSKLLLYDLANNQELYSTEKPDLATPLWVSATEYVYEKNKIVWRADTAQKTAHAVGTLLRNATAITSTDGKSFLVTTFGQDTAEPKSIVYRLTSEPFDRALSAASEQVPISGPNYRILFVNLDKPRLIIDTVASVNNPDDIAAYRAKLTSLRADATADLQSKGIDLNAFTLTFVPAD